MSCASAGRNPVFADSLRKPLQRLPSTRIRTGTAGPRRTPRPAGYRGCLFARGLRGCSPTRRASASDRQTKSRPSNTAPRASCAHAQSPRSRGTAIQRDLRSVPRSRLKQPPPPENRAPGCSGQVVSTRALFPSLAPRLRMQCLSHQSEQKPENRRRANSWHPDLPGVPPSSGSELALAGRRRADRLRHLSRLS